MSCPFCYVLAMCYRPPSLALDMVTLKLFDVSALALPFPSCRRLATSLSAKSTITDIS